MELADGHPLRRAASTLLEGQQSHVRAPGRSQAGRCLSCQPPGGNRRRGSLLPGGMGRC